MGFQGYAEKGGVSASAAQQLHARSGAAAAFEAIWDLVRPGTVSASLDCAGFCLFMHLLKTSMKGIQLPAAIAPEQVQYPVLLPFTTHLSPLSRGYPAGLPSVSKASSVYAQAWAH